MIKISPEVGLSRPANIPKSVYFPEPEGPITAKDEEAFTVKLILSSMTISSSLKITFFDKFLAFIIIK